MYVPSPLGRDQRLLSGGVVHVQLEQTGAAVEAHCAAAAERVNHACVHAAHHPLRCGVVAHSTPVCS